jgi:diguanylate cyclase (GGDEF)-like protein
MNGDNQKSTQTIESLRVLKRRIYLWAMAAALLAQLLSWIPKALAGTLTPYEGVIFPVITVLCLSLLVAMWRTIRALVWVELSLFAIMTIGMLARLLEILQSPINRFEGFSDLLYWFPLAYVMAFLIFESRRQLLIASLLFFFSSVAVGLVHTVPDLLRGDTTDIYVLGRFYFANATYIFLLIAGARLNEQYVRVHVLAETMTHLAHTDALMQISNRRELEATLAREVNRATRHSQPLSAVLFDLDHFKHVNDNYGHQVGDTVLQETARLVQVALRTSDFLGRWGGEEFLVIAPQTDSIQAHRLAERLRNDIAIHPHKQVGRITASFGVAQYQAGELPETWLKRADNALYVAKQNGRNCVATAESSLLKQT